MIVYQRSAMQEVRLLQREELADCLNSIIYLLFPDIEEPIENKKKDENIKI